MAEEREGTLSSAPLLTEQRGATLWVTLNRPERMNALNRELVDDLHSLFAGLPDRQDVRVVILRGSGTAFCAGLDLKERRDGGYADVRTHLAGQRSISRIMLAMRQCPQPVVALLNGPASGGGFAIALASDIRIGTPDARMNAAFIRIGLSACDTGVSYFLPRMVGASVAAEYMMTGRFLAPERAAQLGLISRIVAPEFLLGEGEALVEDMLRATPLGLQLTKEALGHAIDASSLQSVIAMEDRNQVLCARDDNFAEGMASFLEKRPPEYR